MKEQNVNEIILANILKLSKIIKEIKDLKKSHEFNETKYNEFNKTKDDEIKKIFDAIEETRIKQTEISQETKDKIKDIFTINNIYDEDIFAAPRNPYHGTSLVTYLRDQLKVLPGKDKELSSIEELKILQDNPRQAFLGPRINEYLFSGTLFTERRRLFDQTPSKDSANNHLIECQCIEPFSRHIDDSINLRKKAEELLIKNLNSSITDKSQPVKIAILGSGLLAQALVIAAKLRKEGFNNIHFDLLDFRYDNNGELSAKIAFIKKLDYLGFTVKANPEDKLLNIKSASRSANLYKLNQNSDFNINVNFYHNKENQYANEMDKMSLKPNVVFSCDTFFSNLDKDSLLDNLQDIAFKLPNNSYIVTCNKAARKIEDKNHSYNIFTSKKSDNITEYAFVISLKKTNCNIFESNYKPTLLKKIGLTGKEAKSWISIKNEKELFSMLPSKIEMQNNNSIKLKPK